MSGNVKEYLVRALHGCAHVIPSGINLDAGEDAKHQFFGTGSYSADNPRPDICVTMDPNLQCVFTYATHDGPKSLQIPKSTVLSIEGSYGSFGDLSWNTKLYDDLKKDYRNHILKLTLDLNDRYKLYHINRTILPSLMVEVCHFVKELSSIVYGYLKVWDITHPRILQSKEELDELNHKHSF